MNAEELDAKFDEGVEILEYFDLNSAKRPGLETKRVNVDFPVWMVEALDREAQRLGVHRQAIIKTWIARILDEQVV
ncbi:type II toxin-antitoxin system BrnA family antitoxin [Lyngbya confervoides]|uniref:BrnA antitoxin family protein n=1 Tax=Lyngbya confervoides BDU141951 TaxID=1574623 RepID=A0ABD4T5J9_9CYAN|nr:CopG family transcriptional regulator [Lyngbya confervoides]MCM1983698.1 BrnA antitoxin family protein [Lyngbya confervoides BDU141951]